MTTATMNWSKLELTAVGGSLVDIEFRHLAALKAIQEERSFRGAAEALGYVQSAVSHQIAALERSVGMRLVDRQRGSQPVSLTPAGSLLITHGDAMLREMAEAQRRLVALSEGRAGTLRVGAFQSVAVHILPRVKSAFARAFPDFSIVVMEANGDELLVPQLEAGALDLAFVEEPCPDGPFERVEVSADPFVALVPAGSPLADREDAPSLAEIASSPLVGFNFGHSQTAMLAELAARGIEPEFAIKVDLNPTIAPLVAAGLGFAIVPFLTVDPGDARTTVLELPELPARRISIAWHRNRPLSPMASAFVELAQRLSPRFRVTEPAAADPVTQDVATA